MKTQKHIKLETKIQVKDEVSHVINKCSENTKEILKLLQENNELLAKVLNNSIEVV